MSKLFGLALTLSFAVQASESEFAHRELPSIIVFGVADGLAQLRVNAIRQDAEGRLWLATQGGLQAFDGRNFTTFTRQPGVPGTLPGTRIDSLLIDHQGGIWVGMFHAGLSRLEPSTGVVSNTGPGGFQTESHSDDSVMSLCQQGDGALWAAGDHGLQRVDPTTGRRTSVGPTGLASRVACGQSTAYAYFRKHGLVRVQGEKIEFLYAAQSLPSQVTAMLVHPNGQLLLGFNSGLYTLDPPPGVPMRRLWPDTDQAAAAISDILPEGSDSVWLASQNQGLLHIKLSSGSLLEQLRQDPGDPRTLPSDRLFSVWRDRNGVLWAGGQGLFHIAPASAGLASYAERVAPNRPYEGNPNSIAALAQSSDGTLWFSLLGGGLKSLAPGAKAYRHHSATLAQALASPQAVQNFSLAATGDRLWVVSDQGLFRLDDDAQERPVHFPNTRFLLPGGRESTLQHVLMDNQGRVWFGNDVALWQADAQGETFTPYPFTLTEQPTLWGREAYRVRQLGLSAEGTIRILMTHGLVDFDPISGGYQELAVAPGQNSRLAGDYTSLHESRDGTLWLGSRDGLSRGRPGSQGYVFHDYLRQSGLPNAMINAIAEDSDGQLWLSTNNGLSRFDPKTEVFRHFGREAGVSVQEFNTTAYAKLMDGRLIFGGMGGWTALRPEAMRPAEFTPRPLLSRYQLGLQPVSSGLFAHGLTLGPSDQRLWFEFSHDYHRARGAVRFRYRLLSYDTTWNDSPELDIAAYSRLPPGDYRLEVQAAPVDGPWNPAGLNLPIQVIPPWYRTPASYFSFSALTLISLGGVGYRRYRNLRAIRQSEERLSLALSGPDVGIWDWDFRRDRVFRAGLSGLGYDLRELPAEPEALLARVHPDDRSTVQTLIAQLQAGASEVVEADYRLQHEDGTWLWVHNRGQIVTRDRQGKPLRASGTLSNIQERKQAEFQLRQLATVDTLTHLPNRHSFQTQLAQRLTQANTSSLEVSLLFVDLDRFKHINDALGHQFGDQVLSAVALRLHSVLPVNGDIARLGGDEFTLTLLGPDSANEAEELSKIILLKFHTPLAIGMAEVVCTPSIGIAIFPSQASNAEDLIRFADTAMYHAKADGRNCFRLYTEAMADAITRRQQLESALRKALANKEFVLYFQPKRNFRHGGLAGAEVLLRWFSSELGSISPAEFIPILEDTGQIHDVGAWVLTQACRTQLAWLREGLKPPRLAVNVSMHQMENPAFPHELASLLTDTGLAPEHLEIELTESAVMKQPEAMVTAMGKLKSLGVSLSLDDFGTGFSNFAYLTRLPIDKLKIDQSLIAPIADNGDAATVCQAMIAMAHTLGCAVIAEGVETERQRKLLTDYDCDQEQGYLFSKPLSEKDMRTLLRSHGTPPDEGAGQRS